MRGLLRLLREEGVTEYTEHDGGGYTVKLVGIGPLLHAKGVAEAGPEPRRTFMSGPYGELERELWPDGSPFAKAAEQG